MPRLPEPSRWFVVGAVLLVAFVVCGIFSRGDASYLLPPDFIRATYFSVALGGIAYALPNLLALAMIWIGFARPQWSDRLLWSAAMVLTSIELAGLARLAFRSHGTGTFPLHFYPNPALVSGLLAYGSLLTVVAPCAAQGRRVPVGVAAGAGLVAIVALVPLSESIRAIDFAGSLLFAGTLFAFGVALAERLGIDLFRRDASDDAA